MMGQAVKAQVLLFNNFHMSCGIFMNFTVEGSVVGFTEYTS